MWQSKEGEGKTERRRRGEENEKKRFGGSSGSSGSQAINISCKAGKAGLAIFRKAKGCAFATFNGRRPEIQVAVKRIDANSDFVDACYILRAHWKLREGWQRWSEMPLIIVTVNYIVAEHLHRSLLGRGEGRDIFHSTLYILTFKQLIRRNANYARYMFDSDRTRLLAHGFPSRRDPRLPSEDSSFFSTRLLPEKHLGRSVGWKIRWARAGCTTRLPLVLLPSSLLTLAKCRKTEEASEIERRASREKRARLSNRPSDRLSDQQPTPPLGACSLVACFLYLVLMSGPDVSAIAVLCPVPSRSSVTVRASTFIPTDDDSSHLPFNVYFATYLLSRAFHVQRRR